MRARLLAWLVAVGVALPAGGCVTIPSLEGNSIAISDVVERVKCDLADALPDPYKYPWMAGWVAKVDLTLVINEQAGLTPTVSFVDLRPNAVVPGVGNIAQSFIFGAAAGATTTAVRTDSLSFSLSLVELRYKRDQANCKFAAGLGLDGELGLKEWIRLRARSGRPRRAGGRLSPAAGGSAIGEGQAEAAASAAGNDPPLNSISHQAQFIVGLAGSVSPNFTSGAVPWAVDAGLARRDVAREDAHARHRHGLAARQQGQHQRLRHRVDQAAAAATDPDASAAVAAAIRRRIGAGVAVRVSAKAIRYLHSCELIREEVGVGEKNWEGMDEVYNTFFTQGQSRPGRISAQPDSGGPGSCCRSTASHTWTKSLPGKFAFSRKSAIEVEGFSMQ